MNIAIILFLIVATAVFYTNYQGKSHSGKEILKKIEDNEILVHFLYENNFKGKKIEKDSLINKDLFLPNKGGVSHQRYTYCDENKCKYYAKKDNFERRFAGFVIFKKKSFEVIKETYILNERSEFKAIIKSTPLDVNNIELPEEVKIYVESKGNPSHADLVYINPAMKLDEPSPNVAIRSFSRKLSKICEVIIDEKKEESEYYGKSFNEFFIKGCQHQ